MAFQLAVAFILSRILRNATSPGYVWSKSTYSKFLIIVQCCCFFFTPKDRVPQLSIKEMINYIQNPYIYITSLLTLCLKRMIQKSGLCKLVSLSIFEIALASHSVFHRKKNRKPNNGF